MATPTPNTQLQAALTQYGTQPGVSAQDAAQLQAAIMADADLMLGMNSAAAAGKLVGFAPATAGATSPTLGTLDTQTGVLTLPTLHPAGSNVTGSSQSDLTATLKLQEMNLRFAQQPGVTADMVRNLQATFNGSPVLVDQTLQRVHAGDLKHLALHTQGVAGGSYSPGNQTMNLVPSTLQFSSNPPTALDQQQNLTFVLGHELQHGANRQTKAQDVQAASAEMHRVARDANPVNDYTAGIAIWQQAAREDEAKAHLSGWNALLSMEKERRGNPNAGLAEMWGLPSGSQAQQRVADFMEQDPANPGAGIPKTGLTFNLDGTLSPTPANVTAMGRHYYNQPPLGARGVAPQNTVGIGHHGDSDYANTTGAAAVSHAIEIERRIAIPKHGAASQMRINMQQLGLDETLLERNGLDLRVNTGTRQPYVNTGTTPATPGNFDHTHDPATHPNDGHQHVPVDPASVPAMRRGNGQQVDAYEVRDIGRISPRLNEPSHPDHTMFRQILSGVHAEDRKRGREPDDLSEQVAAGLTVGAKARGLSSIGFLEFSPDGSRAYMTDTQDPSTERAKTAVGDVSQVARQSMGVSSDKVAELSESLSMEQQQNLSHQTQPSQDSANRNARIM
jgi:hypothetical protein